MAPEEGAYMRDTTVINTLEPVPYYSIPHTVHSRANGVDLSHNCKLGHEIMHNV